MEETWSQRSGNGGDNHSNVGIIETVPHCAFVLDPANYEFETDPTFESLLEPIELDPHTSPDDVTKVWRCRRKTNPGESYCPFHQDPTELGTTIKRGGLTQALLEIVRGEANEEGSWVYEELNRRPAGEGCVLDIVPRPEDPPDGVQRRQKQFLGAQFGDLLVPYERFEGQNLYPIDLRGAIAARIDWSNTSVPCSILASELQAREFRCDGATVSGDVELSHASITDDVSFVRAVITGSVRLLAANVGGSIRFQHSTVNGRVDIGWVNGDRYSEALSTIDATAEAEYDELFNTGLKTVEPAQGNDPVRDVLDSDIETAVLVERTDIAFDGTVVGGDIQLGDVDGDVWICGTTVGGNVSANSVEIGGYIFILANVRGNVDFFAIEVAGSIWLKGSYVEEAVDVFQTQTGGAIVLERVKTGGHVKIEHSEIGGNVDMSNATLEGDVVITRLIEGSVIGSGATVSGELIICEGLVQTEISGMLLLWGLKLGGNLRNYRSRIHGDVWAWYAEIGGDVNFNDSHIKGDLTFRQACVGGDLDCSGVISKDFNATFAHVGESILLREAEIHTDALLFSSTTGRDISFESAEIGGRLSLDKAESGGDVLLTDARIGQAHRGTAIEVALTAMEVYGSLNLAGAMVNGHINVAFADGANMDAQTISRVHGLIDLSGCTGTVSIHGDCLAHPGINAIPLRGATLQSLTLYQEANSYPDSLARSVVYDLEGATLGSLVLEGTDGVGDGAWKDAFRHLRLVGVNFDGFQFNKHRERFFESKWDLPGLRGDGERDIAALATYENAMLMAAAWLRDQLAEFESLDDIDHHLGQLAAFVDVDSVRIRQCASKVACLARNPIEFLDVLLDHLTIIAINYDTEETSFEREFALLLYALPEADAEDSLWSRSEFPKYHPYADLSVRPTAVALQTRMWVKRLSETLGDETTADAVLTTLHQWHRTECDSPRKFQAEQSGVVKEHLMSPLVADAIATTIDADERLRLELKNAWVPIAKLWQLLDAAKIPAGQRRSPYAHVIGSYIDEPVADEATLESNFETVTSLLDIRSTGQIPFEYHDRLDEVLWFLNSFSQMDEDEQERLSRRLGVDDLEEFEVNVYMLFEELLDLHYRWFSERDPLTKETTRLNEDAERYPTEVWVQTLLMNVSAAVMWFEADPNDITPSLDELEATYSMAKTAAENAGSNSVASEFFFRERTYVRSLHWQRFCEQIKQKEGVIAKGYNYTIGTWRARDGSSNTRALDAVREIDAMGAEESIPSTQEFDSPYGDPESVSVESATPWRFLWAWIRNSTLRYLTGYGEKPERVFGSAFVVLAVFTLVYVVGFSLVEGVNSLAEFVEVATGNLLPAITLSVGAFATLLPVTPFYNGPPCDTDSIGCQILQLTVQLEGYIGLFLAAMFVFTLTRSVRR